MFRGFETLSSLSQKYSPDIQEILVLTGNDIMNHCYEDDDSMCLIQHFLAYIDLATGELKKVEGKISWLMPEDQFNQPGHPKLFFKEESVLRARVRPLKNVTGRKGLMPGHCNDFMLVDVAEENVANDELLAYLEDHKIPVVYEDAILGKFTMQKGMDCYAGKIKWLGKEVSADIILYHEEEGTLEVAIDTLRKLFAMQERVDQQSRQYAAEKLTPRINKWRAHKQNPISEHDFRQRLSMSGLSVDGQGDYQLFYEEEKILGEDAAVVSGNILTGISSADILD